MQEIDGIPRRNRALESHPAADGLPDRQANPPPRPLQAFDWNAVSFGDDCVVAGLLQLHTFENMTLRVKRTASGAAPRNFGSTVMGGAVLGRDHSCR